MVQRLTKPKPKTTRGISTKQSAATDKNSNYNVSTYKNNNNDIDPLLPPPHQEEQTTTSNTTRKVVPPPPPSQQQQQQQQRRLRSKHQHKQQQQIQQHKQQQIHDEEKHPQSQQPHHHQQQHKSKNLVLYFILILSIFCGLAFNIQTRGIVLFNCSENNNNIENSVLPTIILKQNQTLIRNHSTANSINTKTSSDNNNNNNNNNNNHDDWPGRPVENVGHPLVFKGTNFVSNSRQLLLETYFDEFLTIYKNRPDPINLCGIRFNHAYALFLSVKVLQPTTVIESGVNAGQSTYFIRQAASPTTKIIPIDPLDEPICGQKGRWIDTVNSEYYTGTKNFQDFDDIDWNSKIQNGQIDPDRTLVFIDDHLVFLDRFLTLLKFGFRHIVIEDNYKLRCGSTPSDKAGFTAKQLLARNDGDGDAIFFWNQLISYAEFPPLIAPIHVPYKFTGVDRSTRKKGGFLTIDDDNDDMVHPLLRPDVSTKDKELFVQIATTLNEDPEMSTYESYMQFMNYNSFAYMELLPLAPRLAGRVDIKKKTR